ncbi:cupin domain-containing protein [Oceanobacillus saliphilus]|uniref:cupin domain-containing protein n=1 Tax=Oceanobacillus saliphilus TaxID=2925834 RepID=UPI00201D5DB6|nr:cupin domain-containing protein [Oceanobacillus saliphilus]
MSGDFVEHSQQELDAIQSAIKGKASTVEFYSRLADIAPNQQDKEEILHAVENEKALLQQFTDLYRSFTGREPDYEIDNVTFSSYSEGLQKAYEAILEAHEEYRNSYQRTQQPPIQQVFLQAGTEEVNLAKRFSSLGSHQDGMEIRDYGSRPFVVDIEEATKQNRTFRTALWTGSNLQVTLMSIAVGDDIGLEIHPAVDQFLRIEEGQGLVQMGDRQDRLDFQARVYDDYAIMVPAGKWHNLTNTGDKPLKLYTIYAPPEHPFGTVHVTKADAIAAEQKR